MKQLIIFILGLTNLLVSAQESLINFHRDLSWPQILDSATREKKLVFIDIYTDWCAPCRRMDQEVFNLKSVAEVFNKNFICYKVNAEKGEGIGLAKKYKVDGYPYLLFTDGSGNLVYSMLGYRTERELLQESDLASNELKDPKPLGIWQAEYGDHKNDTIWLSAYIQKRNKLRLDNARLLEDYYTLIKPTDYMRAQNLLLIIKSRGIPLNGKLFDILTKHFGEIDIVEDSIYYLENSLLGVFETAINKIAIQAIDEKNEKLLLTEVVPAYVQLPKKIRKMPWYEAQDENKWKVIFYNQTVNIKKLIPVADQYFRKYYFNLTVRQVKESDSIIHIRTVEEYKKEGVDSSSPMIKKYFLTYTTNDHLEKLLGAVNTIYMNSKNPAELKYALKWTKRALNIQQSTTTYEFYGKVLYALKRRPEAISALRNAIALSSDDYEKDKLNELLTKMQDNVPL